MGLLSPIAVAAQASSPVAATTAAITAADARLRVGIIAADSMEGRETGTRGALRARNYLAAELARMGVRPAGDGGTYFAAVPLERSAYTFTASARTASGERTLTAEEIVPLIGVAGIPGLPRPSGEGPIVYAGYALDETVTAERELTPA
ncbi:MAG TPA: hypothetical protein VFH27_11675, partial [Longimicrobiaceae bacterium]|nr:hypothetical protein [Longimicrobiaceae bacterium]